MLCKIIYTLFTPNPLLLSRSTKNISSIFPTCYDAPISGFSLQMKIRRHRRDLPDNTGGTKSTKCVTNSNLRRSHFVKTGKIGFNQSLIYIHPFPHCHPSFFICPCSNLYKKIFRKDAVGGRAFARYFPPSGYAYVSRGSEEIIVMKQ